MLAQEEARRLGHNFVGTEQILLGLIGEGTGIAAKTLKSMGVNLKDARVEVEKIIGRGVMKALEIPEPVFAAVEQIWQGVGGQPPVTLGDVLILANDLATTLSPLQPPSAVAIHDADNMVNFTIGDESLTEILEDATEQIESLREALLH